MNKPLESREIPSLITEVARAEENEVQLKAAIETLHTLVDKIIDARSKPINAQYRNMLANPYSDPRRVDFNLDPEVTGTKRALTLILETDGQLYSKNSTEYTIQLSGGKKERLVLFSDHAHFVVIPPGMHEQPSYSRDATLAEILAYTEVVEFANSHIPHAG